jgi:hypothetical protein
MDIGIEIQQTDALKIETDVLVLKYAQEFFGVDSLAFSKLALVDRDFERSLPSPGEFLLVGSQGSLGARHVLFAGVDRLWNFRYKEIRDFAFRSLQYLGATKPDARQVCFTTHGVSYGLDEKEAFESQLAGILEAVSKGLYPSSLTKITIAEIHGSRAERLRAILRDLFPNGGLRLEKKEAIAERNLRTDLLLRTGIHSEDKPLIFVAMPFDKKMDDIFHYGIRNAVNNAGFLCERADEVVFTGDLLDLIKRRIAQASLVIADLTTSNPNVYLEVGYAWGCGIPTVLIAQDPQELKFDVKGQKCIIYSGIRELEEKLSKELLGLR